MVRRRQASVFNGHLLCQKAVVWAIPRLIEAVFFKKLEVVFPIRVLVVFGPEKSRDQNSPTVHRLTALIRDESRRKRLPNIVVVTQSDTNSLEVVAAPPTSAQTPVRHNPQSPTRRVKARCRLKNGGRVLVMVSVSHGDKLCGLLFLRAQSTNPSSALAALAINDTDIPAFQPIFPRHEYMTPSKSAARASIPTKVPISLAVASVT